MSTRVVEPRPLRLGNTSAFAVHVKPLGSVYGISKKLQRARISSPITILPINDRKSSQWSKITFDPIRATPDMHQQPTVALPIAERPPSTECIHRAQKPRFLKDKQLRREPPSAAAFQDTDGVLLLEQGRVAEHHFLTVSRQALLSVDWLHKAHKVKKRVWKLRATQTRLDYGDIFFGLTEAQASVFEGRSVVFDVRGNFWLGVSASSSPVSLSHTFRFKELAAFNGASSSGDPSVCGPNSEVHVIADMSNEEDVDNGKMTVQIYADGACGEDGVRSPTAEFSFPLERWSSARLLVSFSSPQDVVEMIP